MYKDRARIKMNRVILCRGCEREEKETKISARDTYHKIPKDPERVE